MKHDVVTEWYEALNIWCRNTVTQKLDETWSEQ